uniref:Nephrin n=1 Tax=Glossina brevipalpis TaxID=37001 RepID=A0A1A9X2I9_9MUSC
MAESIQGTIARLPCNVTPPLLDDRVALVIWYKVGSKTPIYSVDTRESNFSHGTHWSDEAYRERLSFTLEGRTGTLAIKTTHQEDTGEYRCRVDFQKSPTRNSKVNLTVIIPPESIIILDSKGATIKDHTLGPYNEGAMINITCVAIGGQPQPRVTWWHETTLLDSSSHALSDRRVGNVLSLGKLKRKNLHMQLTCQAANNNLTVPITNTVTLDMNLRPLLVKLQGENRPLSADNSYQLSCVVIGSRPTPTITWWKGSTPMKNTHEIANPDGNMTTSILTFTPTIDDRNKYLSCRAEQTMIPESGMEDGWKLDIYHIPVVSLELGTNSMNSTLREGIDVFFECNIKSNPWISKVSWRHNGNILENNIAEGIIVANQSLVLQNVSRARSGIYTCVGSNPEGDGESNPVHLDILAPVCRQNQRFMYSTGRHETVKIACEIEANPAEAAYVWKFNATLGETIDIPASLVVIDRGRSIAHYTPMTENDYGTLLCWASNEIGDQSEPCVYTITPAGEPDPLINCTLLNQTSTGFQIECMEGFDGGLQQDFIMEVYVNGTTRHPKIYKSNTPYFEVRGLIPGAGYNVFLIAHNSKGRSNATILQVYTLKDPEKQTDLSLAYAPVIEDIRPFLGILVGIVGSIVLVALIIVIIVRMRGSTGRDRNNYTHGHTTTTTTTATATTQGHRHNNTGMNGLHNGSDIHVGRVWIALTKILILYHTTDLTHADLMVTAAGQQRLAASYCSATLGRHRQADLKRAEPNIYSQIDLAHHPMYSTSPMFATNTITGVTMSHPSQLATFTPPPSIFAHKVLHTNTQTTQQQQQQIQHSGKSGGGGGGGGSGDVGLLQTAVGSVCIAGIPATHHNTQSIICTSQKRPQSPKAVPLAAAASSSSSSLSATTSASNSALTSSATLCAGGVVGSGAGILSLQGNGNVVGANSMGISGVYPNEATTSSTGLLKPVPEEISYHHQHHQISGEKVLITQDRNHITRF